MKLQRRITISQGLALVGAILFSLTSAYSQINVTGSVELPSEEEMTAAYRPNFVPIGSEEDRSLERELFETSAGRMSIPIGPKTLENSIAASKLNKEYLDDISKRLHLVLKSNLIPGDLDLNTWRGIKDASEPYIVGEIEPDNTVDSIYVAANKHNLYILFESKELFSDSPEEIDSYVISKFTTRLVQYPIEKIGKASVTSTLKEYDDQSFCYGIVKCGEDERRAGKTQYWWFSVQYWYTEGRLSMSFDTDERVIYDFGGSNSFEAISGVNPGFGYDRWVFPQKESDNG